MNEDIKTQALMATAEAFYRRGDGVQYDQLSMDRLLRITPRHNKFSTPEEATEQHTLFLDCACFTNACYYAAFGTVLEADVTWNMMEIVGPKVYDYTVTHHETEEERERIKNEVLALLRPGDLLDIWYYYHGHIILMGEDGMYYHCTGHGKDPSYHYNRRCSEYTPGGSMYHEPIAERFDPNYPKYLLGDKVKRFTVMRPLDQMGELTANALARLGSAKNLRCSVLSSHPGGKTARPREAVTYTVRVQNESDEARMLQLSITPAEHTELIGTVPESVTVEGRGTVEIPVAVRYVGGIAAYAEAPAVTVNGLTVWAERFLLQWGNKTEETPAKPESILNDLFLRYDSQKGDVLWRKPQMPWQDGCLYSYFGGTGVVTPELGSCALVRARRMTLADLQPGDRILCSDDALFQRTYACCVTAEGLVGVFEPETEAIALTGEETARFVDSLPGRFCYVVQRPAVKMN